jgi:chemotaxis protein histidine kinase CheA
MTMWNEQWATMRAQFLTRAKDRLAQLAAAIDEFDQKRDIDTLMRIHKDFHWLAGVGGTYQLPEISALGSNGEDICTEIIQRKREIAADDPQRFRDILASVNSVISAAV